MKYYERDQGTQLCVHHCPYLQGAYSSIGGLSHDHCTMTHDCGHDWTVFLRARNVAVKTIQNGSSLPL